MGSTGSKASGADSMAQNYDNDDAFTPRNDRGIGDNFVQEKFALSLLAQSSTPGHTILQLGPVKRNLKYYQTTTAFSPANRFVQGDRIQIWPTAAEYPINMPDPASIHASTPLSSEHQGDHVELLNYTDIAYYNANPDARA